MNLLLLLSALLSALTGGGTVARPGQVAVACARTAESAVAARRVSPVAAARPLAELPALTNISSPTWRLAAFVPLFLSRRRE